MCREYLAWDLPLECDSMKMNSFMSNPPGTTKNPGSRPNIHVHRPILILGIYHWTYQTATLSLRYLVVVAEIVYAKCDVARNGFRRATSPISRPAAIPFYRPFPHRIPCVFIACIKTERSIRLLVAVAKRPMPFVSTSGRCAARCGGRKKYDGGWKPKTVAMT